ncbi:hypothetical protein HDU81_002723 [Chytriomyces hyalinus]|nr:hypothetical protein HDU81_002723 [Chytriomyces hyalinus]
MSVKKSAVVCVMQWNSLRVSDQPVLQAALKLNSDYLVAMHVVDRQFVTAGSRASARRRAFYVASVRSLQTQLVQRGTGLLVLEEPLSASSLNGLNELRVSSVSSVSSAAATASSGTNPSDDAANFSSTKSFSASAASLIAQKVALLLETCRVDAVCVEDQNTVHELHFVAALKKAMAKLNLKLIVTPNAQTIVKHNAIASKFLPDTYTQFRLTVEKSGNMHRELFQIPSKLPPLPPAFEKVASEWHSSLSNETCASLEMDPRSAFPFAAGEKAALQRIQNYFNQTHAIKTYKDTRNELIGTQYSSKLSPFLAFGCVSASTVHNLLQEYESTHGGNESTYWLLFELLWRDYFQFIGKKYGSQLYHLRGITTSTESIESTWKYNAKKFEAWKTGRTGIPFVDANMRELLQTGFMSNRGRQNVASFLVRDLNLPWTLGAKWFEKHLLDHEPCSNYGNWQYVAGVGNDPRSDRYFNVIKQGKDYDPEGAYVKLWCPELKNVPVSVIHCPWKMSFDEQKASEVALGVTYPLPIVEADAWKKHYAYSTKGKVGKANPSETVGRRPKKK